VVLSVYEFVYFLEQMTNTKIASVMLLQYIVKGGETGGGGSRVSIAVKIISRHNNKLFSNWCITLVKLHVFLDKHYFIRDRAVATLTNAI